MDEDISQLKTTSVCLLNDLGCNGSTLSEDLINELYRYGASELHVVAAFIGGVASQKVIKVKSNLTQTLEATTNLLSELSANTTMIYHHGKLLALREGDKPYVVKVLEDGDMQTLGMLGYNKRLQHSFTAHPKVDPVTREMFTFGYSQTPPYATYRVISKDGVMQDPAPITIPTSRSGHSVCDGNEALNQVDYEDEAFSAQ
ncbi:Carotenoid 9,10(9',10')-cleavage dioxygenase 1 [Capsicum baccatum]|uniref:carotenoid 9,10-dioxygenase n=1 Tax=Capsicum baccatum TaxID=33114 RepID=A0A2G2WRC5_CAPBA|nr:Carotenoid 9,10(9',10')-cleavage dioxygenase 1 [Capsicum baccatum]